MGCLTCYLNHYWKPWINYYGCSINFEGLCLQTDWTVFLLFHSLLFLNVIFYIYFCEQVFILMIWGKVLKKFYTFVKMTLGKILVHFSIWSSMASAKACMQHPVSLIHGLRSNTRIFTRLWPILIQTTPPPRCIWSPSWSSWRPVYTIISRRIQIPRWRGIWKFSPWPLLHIFSIVRSLLLLLQNNPVTQEFNF